MNPLKALKNAVKSRLYGKLGYCYNPHGLSFSLAKHLKTKTGLRLIDIGAHQGKFTAAVDAFCGVSRGLLIEAQPSRAAALGRQFPAPRFEVISVAVSDNEGTVEFHVNEFDATSSLLSLRNDLPELKGLDMRPKEKIVCRTATLDSLVKRTEYPKVDLLKLDVQGAELLALKGGLETLQRTDLVWTEVSFKRLYNESCLFSELLEFMSEAGFSLQELEGGFRSAENELLQGDALFKRNEAWG